MSTTTRTALFVITTMIAAHSALAFSLETSATDGCHERITRAALARTGWPDGSQAPPPTRDDLALRAALPFHADDASPWEVALLVGVRDNDLHGLSPADLDQLSAVHQSARFQEEHCLRGPDDDGDAERAAIATCRAFIVAHVRLALSATDERATELVRVALTDAPADVPLSTFAVHMGRAMHALQDSYAHDLRHDDHGAIEHVLNYVDVETSAHYDPNVDGFPHQSAFDRCTADNDVRVAAAEDASAALLAAVSHGTRDEKLAAVNAVLDDKLAVDDRCVGANAWCHSIDEIPASCAQTNASSCGAFAFVLALFFAFRRRNVAKLAVAALVCTCVAQRAHADEPTKNDVERRTVLVVGPLANVGVDRPWLGVPVALSAGAGVGVDHGGGAFSLGARIAPLDRVSLGVDVAWNPWFDALAGKANAGVASMSVRGDFAWLDFDRAQIATSASLGGCALLFDTYGARAGDVGPLVALSLVEVRWHALDHVDVVVEPARFALPVPHTKGVPLAYRQYELAASLEWWL